MENKVRVNIENVTEWQEDNIHQKQAPKCYSFSQGAANKSRKEDKVYYLYINKKKSLSYL